MSSSVPTPTDGEGRRTTSLASGAEAVVRRGASLVLVFAAVFLAFPYACLVTTSAMWPRETAEVARLTVAAFRLPYRVIRTPYVADAETRDFERPATMSEETWATVRQLIEPVLWDAAQPLLATREVPDAVRNQLREQLTRRIWERIVRDVPESLWEAPPNRIRAALDAEVTPLRVEEAWGFLYRAIRLAPPIVETSDRMEWMASGARWAVQRGGVQVVDTVDAGVAATEVWAAYDADQEAPVAGYVASDLALPVTPSRVRSIVLRVRGDESYHGLTPVLELGGRTYRAERSIVLDGYVWEDIRLVLPGAEAAEQEIALRAGPDAVDAGTLQAARVTLVLRPVPHATAVVRKLSANLVDAWTGMRFPRSLWNTIAVAFVGTVVQLVMCVPAGYAFARLRWPGRRQLFRVVLLTMAVPAQATMIPVFLWMRSVGMYDSLHAVWIRLAFGTGICLYVATRCFARVDRNQELAATLDGCGPLRSFWYTALPAVRPAVVAVAAVQLVGAWGDLASPLGLLSDERRQVLTTALRGLQVADGTTVGVQMAGALLVSAPVLAVLFLARKELSRAVEMAMGPACRSA